MIVIPALGIGVTVANIEGELAREIFGHLTIGFIGTVDRKAIPCKPNHGRVLVAIIFERAFNASGILVIVINPGLLRVSAAGVEPDFGVALDSVHAPLLKGIEEHDAIVGHAHRSHRQGSDLVGQLRFQRQAKGEVLNFNRVGIAAVGKHSRGMIRIALGADDQKRGIMSNA